ncbi:translation elongation factor Ts [Candidatus Gottesmanbacteria bacterium RIFCSPLOWO2_01_FULL_39_12b]|uniref:Elongation factor Ts n=1 Tax=Candidatus Gottesmanbacteria bacterium RIFCSPLOWO2_01_FULL_39_12b TaxID=1798388 RepID=A0A1F6ARI9_9BACT|nr:MAG: translation elongation factor Ts [Candidatus Gottesmanbacteria bacterium RIFCSPLOWO2_01_FULL_39_12b]
MDQLKKLRQKTGAGVMDCRKALEETKGDEKKAEDLLQKWGIEKSEKKADRQTKAGIIDSYIHGGKVGVMLELLCETDFVAKTDDFKNLSHELCLQIASMNPKDVKTLESQEYIRDPKIIIRDLIKQTIGKLGENITVSRFTRYQLGG